MNSEFKKKIKMKKLLILILLSPAYAFCQNVGVNTSSPEFTLDVNGKLSVREIDYVDYKDTVLYQDPATGEIKKTMVQGFGLPLWNNNEKSKIKKLKIGLTLYCKDCIANDGSVGVMQTYNGTTWKNNW